MPKSRDKVVSIKPEKVTKKTAANWSTKKQKKFFALRRVQAANHLHSITEDARGTALAMRSLDYRRILDCSEVSSSSPMQSPRSAFRMSSSERRIEPVVIGSSDHQSRSPFSELQPVSPLRQIQSRKASEGRNQSSETRSLNLLEDHQKPSDRWSQDEWRFPDTEKRTRRDSSLYRASLIRSTKPQSQGRHEKAQEDGHQSTSSCRSILFGEMADSALLTAFQF